MTYPWFHGKASAIWCAAHWDVGFAVTLKCSAVGAVAEAQVRPKQITLEN
jgi:hypothetical protein